jgi:hypothetical protein
MLQARLVESNSSRQVAKGLAKAVSGAIAEPFAASDISNDIALRKSANQGERTKGDERIGRR